jgi:hypothetical protein
VSTSAAGNTRKGIRGKQAWGRLAIALPGIEPTAIDTDLVISPDGATSVFPWV